MKISRLDTFSLCARVLLVTFALPVAAAATTRCPLTPSPSSTANEVAKSDYDALLAQAKKSYKNQKRDFPKAGSQEFQTLKNQAVQFLVQREQFEQEARPRRRGHRQAGGRAARADPEAVLRRRQEEVREAAEGAGPHRSRRCATTSARRSSRRRSSRRSPTSVKVTDKQVEEYYTKNKAQYSQPESREVRHILVKTQGEGGRRSTAS